MNATPEESPLAKLYKPMIEHDGERARQELRALVAREPDSVEARALLAIGYLRCLDFAAAVEANREVLKLEPGHTEALRNLALCLHGLGDTEAAMDAYVHAFKVSRSTDAAAMAAIMTHRLGRLEDARRSYDFLLDRAPLDNLNLITALRGLMNLMRDAGRPLAGDRYAQELLHRHRRKTGEVSSFLIQRDNATGFHEWFRLVDKSHLGEVLRKGAVEDPAGARIPETFNLPRDRAALAAFAAGAPPETLYIVKPIRGSGGQGIAVVGDLSGTIERSDVVVQRYLSRPYLVDGRKGHLRIYAMVTGCDPLRAYVYTEGIVRFAPEPYDPRPERLSEISMHVTNTALHLGHPGLTISDDPAKEDEGSIWSLSAMLRRIEADGHDPQAVFGKISDVVGWFLRLLRRDGFFHRQAAGGPQRSYGPKLFGFDILLDAETDPWLIEIQAAPAAVGAALVNRINTELYETIFKMSNAVLIHDGMPAEQIAGLCKDPGALRAREVEVELANRGRFMPLALDGV